MVQWNMIFQIYAFENWNLAYPTLRSTTELYYVIGRGPLAKIISLRDRGNPLGNRFSVIQCVVP
jgi:hypothetical protein